MGRIARHPLPWLAAFAVWFATLWWLSSRVNHFPPALDFQMSDKVLHFGYFFFGGLSFAAFLYRRSPERPNWDRIVLLSLLCAGLTGALDEWHQSMVPGRSGHDIFDFQADLLGSLCGALVLRRGHRLIA